VENNEIMVQEQAPNMPTMNNGVMTQLDNINQGTVAIEASRAIAEAQGKLVIAKRFPRDEVSAYAKAMEACQRPTMAQRLPISHLMTLMATL
jgi:hypothetical protein